MLTEHQKLTTNPITSSAGVAHKVKDVYVPLGLVERKKQSKRKENDDVSPEQGSDLYKETEITKRFEHNEFLEEVLRQKQSPKSQGNRIAIIGEPGAGKTTLLQHIADWVSSEIKQAIVIWVSLADLKEKMLEDYLYENWLTNVARKTGKALATEQDKDDFATQFKQGRIWLLLDGLDEMSVSSGNALTEITRHIQGGSISQARIILTCRVNLWDTGRNKLDDFDIYRTLDFSYPDQVETFIDRWFSAIPEERRERGQRLCTALKDTRKKRIQDLVKNPLRLTLLCLNWQLREGKLPNTRAELYNQYVDEIYEWRKEQFDIEPEQRKELKVRLAKLAQEAIDRKNSHFRLEHKLVSRFLGEANGEKSLLKLALDVGLLNNIEITPDRKPIYAFYHPTFQEYFAALAIDDWHFFLNHFPDNPYDGIYRIFEPQWKEVILLWLGREEEDISNKNKKSFIEELIDFKDGCGEWCNIDRANRGFYEFQAYFLAAQGIAEFNDCSLINEIVQQIVKYRFGYLNAKTPAYWESFLNEIRYEPLNLLPTTNTTKAIEALISLIRDPKVDNDTRWQVAKSLGEIDSGNPTAIKELIKLIRKPKVSNSYTHLRAAESLEAIGVGNQTAIEGLIAIIRDPQVDTDNRRRAVYSLEKIGIGKQAAIEGLIAIIRDPQVDSYIRRQAAESLGEIDPGNQTAIEGLIAIIREPQVDSYTRRQAAESLGKIGFGNKIAIDALISLIH
ncbi:HEAT repeat domain-containing protein, partial [Nostoc sp. CALU 1950]|uniref:HEAT repeat domain-containing protein n=1 Tax=Nostoc sp. CALU 1950 TaxID=3104321 RepID=UPI003EC02050